MPEDFIEIEEYSEEKDREEKKKAKPEPVKSEKAEKSASSKKPKKNGNGNGKSESDYAWLWIVLILAAIAVALIIVLTQPKDVPKDTTKDELQNYSSDVIDPEAIAANINEYSITAGDVEEIYNRIPAEQQMLYPKYAILDQMITEELLLQEAKIKKITVTTDQIQAVVELIKEQTPEGQTFDEFLTTQNLDAAELNTLIEEDLMKNMLINKSVLSKVSVSKQEIQDYFNENKRGNMTLEQVYDQIERIVLMQKQTVALDDYVKTLRDNAKIEVLMYQMPKQDVEATEDLVTEEDDQEASKDSSEESTETVKQTTTTIKENTVTTTVKETDVTTTTLAKEQNCYSEFGIKDTDVIFYYTTKDTYSNAMIPIVQKLEAEGTKFFWAEHFNTEQKAVLEKCFDLEEKVPQFVCPKTESVKIGTLKESSLRTFVAGCI